MDSLTKSFMDRVHKIRPDSLYYFNPYKSNSRDKQWVSSRYPSTGLQSINTQTFIHSFIHSSMEKTWGWNESYINVLAAKLAGNLLSALDLGIWFFKYDDWAENTSYQDIIEKFFSCFSISKAEQEKLFLPIKSSAISKIFYDNTVVNWNTLSLYISSPPDATPEHGATLAYLEINNVGPASQLIMESSNRLNLITGDNGLGKTFLMECSWWALTGRWSGLAAYTDKINASITYALSGTAGWPIKKTISYDIQAGEWPQSPEDSIRPGLVLYSRIDDSYAIWDPIKQYQNTSPLPESVFSNSDVWNGVPNSIEGLLRDWVKWQNTPKNYPFKELKSVLEKMSPPDLGSLVPGEIVRMRGEIREVPTITHMYGNTPIIHASAGIKRIMTLAYLIVWAWHEHKIAAKLYNVAPEKRMIILIDEIEEHLHPQWQRAILPALLDIHSSLSSELEIQFIISSHSPLVLASAETCFDEEKDALFHLEAEKQSRQILLSKADFIKYGYVNSWLTSPIFGLNQPRAIEAENAINQAKQLQLQDKPNKEQIDAVHQKLLQVLSGDDSFWPRWIYFAEKNGVSV
ncbi:hypothetical protein FACS189494_10880 [Spirochaetia bacterium]|nr:hypothetical protein FACS189494_10880 [Spirochaetia bacterium]